VSGSNQFHAASACRAARSRAWQGRMARRGLHGTGTLADGLDLSAILRRAFSLIGRRGGRGMLWQREEAA